MVKRTSDQNKKLIASFKQEQENIARLQQGALDLSAQSKKPDRQAQLSDEEYKEALKSYKDADQSIVEGIATEFVAAGTALEEAVQIAKTGEEIGTVYIEEFLEDDLEANPDHQILKREINIRKEMNREKLFLENETSAQLSQLNKSETAIEQNPIMTELKENDADVQLGEVKADLSATQQLIKIKTYNN